MSRFQFDNSQQSKGIHPVWRGIGFVMFIGFTVGGFLLTGYLMDLNAQKHFVPFPLPVGFLVTIYKDIKMPGRWLVQAGATVLLDIVAFSLFTIVYGIISPERKDERSPDGYYRRKKN